MHKKTVGVLMVLLIELFSGCSLQKEYRYTVVGQFDTVIEIIGFSSQKEADRYGQTAEALLKKWNALCDAYHPYDGVNGVYAVNKSSGWTEVSDELYALLKFGVQGYKKTDGAVNMMCGAVSRLWKNVTQPPQQSILMEAMKHTDIGALEFDDANRRVRITDPKAALDLGAFAKGYALARVAEQLEKDGFTGILNATSSVVAVGERTARVGIADPKADGYGQIVMLHGKALATSGVNQRFFTYQGKNYHHIIDLKTGYPTDNGTVQASVICDDAAWADVYATAALIQGTSNVPALLYFENGETKTFEEWNHVTQ